MPITIFNPASYQQFQSSGLFVYNAPSVGIVTTNLTHWYDAGNTSSYSGTGAVWTNLVTGTGVNLNLTGSPSFISNGQSSYFVFNGTNQFASSSNFRASGDRAFTLNMVCNFAPIPTGFSNYRFFSDNGNPTSFRVSRESDTNKIVNMSFSQGATNFFGDIAYTPSGNIISASQNYMLTFVSTATNVSLYINGTFFTSSAEPFVAGTATGGGTFWFASSANGNTPLSMSIAHIMWYSSSLSAIDITQNYITLQSRYGLPQTTRTFTTTGLTLFTVPAGVTSMFGLAVGGGGGGAGSDGTRNEGNGGGAGGGLSYGTITVTPGEQLRIFVGAGGTAGLSGGGDGGTGGTSYISGSGGIYIQGGGGAGGQERSTAAAAGGTSTGSFKIGGGNGGAGGGATDNNQGGGGGGAGGYFGNGGAGGGTSTGSNGTGGAGGGGGSTNAGQGYGGGGTNILISGSTGTGGAQNAIGTGGSGGANGTRPAGGLYGGGGGACDDDTNGAGGAGAQGVVYISYVT